MAKIKKILFIRSPDDKEDGGNNPQEKPSVEELIKSLEQKIDAQFEKLVAQEEKIKSLEEASKKSNESLEKIAEEYTKSALGQLSHVDKKENEMTREQKRQDDIEKIMSMLEKKEG